MSLRHGILGFLALEPATGYTLQQRFAGSVGAFWSATQSQIYRELHVLEADALLRVEAVPQDGKPTRKVYQLTATGRAELRRWLAAPVGPMQLRDALLLKMVFAAEVEPAVFDETLASYQRDLEARASEYRVRLDATHIFALARSPREAELWRLSIENGLAWAEAQHRWVTDARKRLARVRHSSKPKKRRAE